MRGKEVLRGFSRAFRASTGKAPYEYITLQRMKKAQELLQGDASITQITKDLNDTNPAKFAAALKQMPPHQPIRVETGD